MSLLRIRNKEEEPRKAIVELANQIWGILPVRILLSLYPVPVEIDIDEAQEIQLRDLIYEYARDLLFDYLAKAEHTELQCRTMLRRRRFHSEIVDECIQLAKEKKFLSDSRYAELYIRSMLDYGKSRREIKSKLKLQKISSSIYDPLLQELYSPEDSRMLLIEEIKKVLSRCMDQSPVKRKEKVFTALYRKGWELDTIRDAWDSLRASEQADD